ncbi:MAG: XdhC/CoxI family protein [Alphaproteobacteria bacterium]|nr:XdhC/CoxI family protein [Alphaproteobacteria bacterium]
MKASEQAEPLFVAEAWQAEGRQIAMATVVETWGSAPCAAGSHLVIDQDGNFHGSVSGGCVEGAVITEAVNVLQTGDPQLLEFGVADEDAWNVGLSCGGRIRVYVEKLTDARLLRRLNAARRAREPAMTITDLDTGGIEIVSEHGRVGPSLHDAVAKAFASGISKAEVIDGRRLFLKVDLPSPKIVVIGAVHISQILAPMAKMAGYDVLIVDPRTAFATSQRFADVDLVAEWPADAFEDQPLDPFTALVALTHDPKFDDFAIGEAIRAGCFYVGALGSRKTHAKRSARLGAAGFTDVELTRIHAPIGLPIGAANPREIAVAILAEIIQSLRTRHAAQQ